MHKLSNRIVTKNLKFNHHMPQKVKYCMDWINYCHPSPSLEFHTQNICRGWRKFVHSFSVRCTSNILATIELVQSVKWKLTVLVNLLLWGELLQGAQRLNQSWKLPHTLVMCVVQSPINRFVDNFVSYFYWEERLSRIFCQLIYCVCSMKTLIFLAPKCVNSGCQQFVPQTFLYP